MTVPKDNAPADGNGLLEPNDGVDLPGYILISGDRLLDWECVV